ncbi:hypothetical protein MetMK1DRAFT_00018230 [Metallosphaera yellowstonensis MK1]|uniref:Uncharacterized protein n=1 Tax=Metallosphaera yellowstonensis MK1 TaxID=671065 RepID=H2C5K0_9CREN|nr:hypothetical protein MetMK1DRAFT_00018230 [Metallosphaera yellowstonensis MK1]
MHIKGTLRYFKSLLEFRLSLHFHFNHFILNHNRVRDLALNHMLILVACGSWDSLEPNGTELVSRPSLSPFWAEPTSSESVLIYK